MKILALLISHRHVFVKHRCPGGNKVKICKKSLSPTFILRPTQGAWDVSEVRGTFK